MSERSKAQLVIICVLGCAGATAKDALNIQSLFLTLLLISVASIIIVFVLWARLESKGQARAGKVSRLANWMRKGEIDTALLSFGFITLASCGLTEAVKAETGATITEQVSPTAAIYLATTISGNIENLSDETKKFGVEIGTLSSNVIIVSEQVANLHWQNEALKVKAEVANEKLTDLQRINANLEDQAGMANTRLSDLQRRMDEQSEIDRNSAASVSIRARRADFVLGVPQNERGRPVEGVRADNALVSGLDKWPDPHNSYYFRGSLFIDLDVVSGLKRDAYYSAVLYDMNKGDVVSRSKGQLIRLNDYSDVELKSVSRVTAEFKILDTRGGENWLVCILVDDFQNNDSIPISTLSVRGNWTEVEYRPVIYVKTMKEVNEVPVAFSLEISSPEVLTSQDNICSKAGF